MTSKPIQFIEKSLFTKTALEHGARADCSWWMTRAIRRGDTVGLYDAIEKGCDVGYGADPDPSIIINTIDTCTKPDLTPRVGFCWKFPIYTEMPYLHLAVAADGDVLYSPRKNDQREIVDLLVAKGADIDEQDKVTGNTALHLAAQMCRTNIAKRLLELGARNDIVNAEGNTPPMLYPLWCHVDKELKAFNKFKKRATK